MGRRGTEVARQAADLVLADDDLATVVAAVAEGRRIYDNIRRFLRYALSGGVAEILVMLAGPLARPGVPLLPAQILWINLLTHGAARRRARRRAGRARTSCTGRRGGRPDGILAGGLVARILLLATVLAGASLGLGVWAAHADRPWQSMVFASLALGQLWVALALRTGGRRFTGNPVADRRPWSPTQSSSSPPSTCRRCGSCSAPSPLTALDLGAVGLASLAGAATVALQRRAHRSGRQRGR